MKGVFIIIPFEGRQTAQDVLAATGLVGVVVDAEKHPATRDALVEAYLFGQVAEAK